MERVQNKLYEKYGILNNKPCVQKVRNRCGKMHFSAPQNTEMVRKWYVNGTLTVR